jgi:hypothetical protein
MADVEHGVGVALWVSDVEESFVGIGRLALPPNGCIDSTDGITKNAFFKDVPLRANRVRKLARSPRPGSPLRVQPRSLNVVPTAFRDIR